MQAPNEWQTTSTGPSYPVSDRIGSTYAANASALPATPSPTKPA